MSIEIHRGGCLCGAVRYEVAGPLRQIVACHCGQCRRTSGHFVAATAARRERLNLTAEEGLRWFRSSDHAQRGFCGTCGSNLFWQQDGAETICIMAGSLDQPTGLKLVAQIFIEDAGDYYTLPQGIPGHTGIDHGISTPS
jgi:hypothetical protein